MYTDNTSYFTHVNVYVQGVHRAKRGREDGRPSHSPALEVPIRPSQDACTCRSGGDQNRLDTTFRMDASINMQPIASFSILTAGLPTVVQLLGTCLIDMIYVCIVLNFSAFSV